MAQVADFWYGKTSVFGVIILACVAGARSGRGIGEIRRR